MEVVINSMQDSLARDLRKRVRDGKKLLYGSPQSVHENTHKFVDGFRVFWVASDVITMACKNT